MADKKMAYVIKAGWTSGSTPRYLFWIEFLNGEMLANDCGQGAKRLPVWSSASAAEKAMECLFAEAEIYTKPKKGHLTPEN